MDRHTAVQKRLNRYRCRLGSGLGWIQERICLMEVHIGATWRIRLNRPCAPAMRPFWATVSKTVRPMLSDSPVLSVLSVTLVYCGHTVRWINMKLGMQVGLDPYHNVLDGDPAPPPLKGHNHQFSAHICCGLDRHISIVSTSCFYWLRQLRRSRHSVRGQRWYQKCRVKELGNHYAFHHSSK